MADYILRDEDYTQLVSALRELEWRIPGDSMRHCPSCGAGQKYGHDRWCSLAKSLKILRQEVRMQDDQR